MNDSIRQSPSQSEIPFEIGREYKRQRDIHDVFSGQKQGGMSTPRNHPFVFLFTSDAGHAYGYDDGWSDGVFVYTGEGQVGDMQFVRNNKALRDHNKNGRRVLLFEKVSRSGVVLYRGEFECGSWEYGVGPDKNGIDRRIIRFHLVLQSTTQKPDSQSISSSAEFSIDELRKKAYQAARKISQAPRTEAARNYYKRSEAVRDYVLARANGVCELCGKSAPFLRKKNSLPYLEPHHTQRVSDFGPDHPRFVAGICPNCHREIHYGQQGPSLNMRLETILVRLEGNS